MLMCNALAGFGAGGRTPFTDDTATTTAKVLLQPPSSASVYIADFYGRPFDYVGGSSLSSTSLVAGAKSIRFNGSGAYLLFDYTNSLSPGLYNGVFSLEYWINTSSNGGSVFNLFGSPGGSNAFTTGLNTSNEFNFFTGNFGGFWPGVAVAGSTNTHVLITSQDDGAGGNTVRFYRNGSIVITESIPGLRNTPTTSVNFLIGNSLNANLNLRYLAGQCLATGSSYTVPTAIW